MGVLRSRSETDRITHTRPFIGFRVPSKSRDKETMSEAPMWQSFGNIENTQAYEAYIYICR